MSTEVKKIPNAKERIYLYDNIKCLAIILVVIGHAINYMTDFDGYTLEKALYVMIYSFHMPLFLFVSGLFLKPMNDETKFPKYKILAFVLIGLVLRMITAVVRMFTGLPPVYATFEIYDTYTWFMWAMAVFTALVWAFRKFDKKYVMLFAVLIGVMAGFDSNLGDEFALMRIAVFFPVFLLGYYLDPVDLYRFLNRRKFKIIAAAFLAACLAAFLFLLFFHRDFLFSLRPIFTGRNRYTALDERSLFGPLYRIFAYLLSIGITLALICLLPNKNLGYVSGIGAKTLQIYFWHKSFLIVFEEIHLYDHIENLTGGIIATVIYILIAVGLVFLCSLPIFSFPTKQLLAVAKKQ